MYPYRDKNTGRFGRAIVANIPDSADFVSDSQDVQPIKEYIGDKAQEYDSFFVIVDNGDYSAVWGMFGIIPYSYKLVKRLI